MGFQWLLDDETPIPAPPAMPEPRRARKAALVIAVVAAGAVTLALWWPRYRANQVLRDVDAQVRTTLERELRAAREGDDEVFRAITGVPLARAARDPATGLTPPLPGVQSLPGVDIRVRAIPPVVRGGAVETAEAELTYQITDGLGTGPYTEHRTLSIDEKGAWHSEPADPARPISADAVRFRQTEWLASHLEIGDPIGPGTTRLLHEAGDADEARAWFHMLAREVNAYCEARDNRPGERSRSDKSPHAASAPGTNQSCELRVALSGAPGTVANVTHSNQTYLVLPSPSAHGALEPTTGDVLQRTAVRHALASLAGIPPFTEPWMDVAHAWPSVQLGAGESDPIPAADSAAYGGRAALRASLLEIWLAQRSLAPDTEDAGPPDGQEPSLLSLLADNAPAVPKATDPALAAAARRAAADIAAATDRDAIPALLASHSEDPVYWLASVLPPDQAEEVAAWPRALEPFPANRIALASCGGVTGFRGYPVGARTFAFLPGRESPVDLDDLACGASGAAMSTSWSPGGAHLAVACSTVPQGYAPPVTEEGRSVVVIAAESMSRVPTEVAQRSVGLGANDLCCVSWSGDGLRLSWLECCPGTPRFASVADTVSALPSPDWTVDWASSVWAAREFFNGRPDGWSGGPAADRAAASALQSGYPMRPPFWANTGMAWAPSGTLAAVWGVSTDEEDPPYPGDGGYVVGDVAGGPIWRSAGHRPVWRPDGELVAEIEALSGTGITATVRAAATGALVARTALTADMVNQAGSELALEADYIEPNDLTFSPDGTWLVVSGRWWQDARAPELGGNFVAAWDPESDAVRVHAAASAEVAAGWRPDGTLRLRRTDEYEAIIESAWHPSTNELTDIARLPGEGGAIESASGAFLMSDPGNGSLVLTKPAQHGGADPRGDAADDLDAWWTYGARACRPVSWQPEGGW